MSSDLIVRPADMAGDLDRLRAFVVAEQGQQAAHDLDRHLARPRYRPAFTCIAERSDVISGYALVGHERRRLGAATLETGLLDLLYTRPAPATQETLEVLLGGCLAVLLEQALPLAVFHGPAALGREFGFAPYRFGASVRLAPGIYESRGALRPAGRSDLEDLAALYEADYRDLPLAEVRAAPDWRAWLAGDKAALALDDSRGRVAAYAAVGRRVAGEQLRVVEAAAADAGAARSLCAALVAYAREAGTPALDLALPPAHRVAQAALHMGGVARIAVPDQGRRPGGADLAGVVDLPGVLAALAPEFERRLALSRYAGWSGNLRVEIETERATLMLEAGQATVIDGSRPADVRLRNVTLPALAQLCLGYRGAADLRATGELACGDSALGLIDALFPVVMPYSAWEEL